MRNKNRVYWLIFLVILLAFPTGLMAQEELTQTFTSADGVFTMSYPEGWTAEEEDDLIRFSSDQAFMQVNYYDWGEEITPLEILELGAPEILGFSEPEDLVVAGYAAVQSVSQDQHQTVINFCGGIMADAIGFVQPGDMPAFEPTFMAMLETIRYGDGEPEICRGVFDTLAPITPANAAQVAEVLTLGDETVSVESVAFSPDGGQFAAGMLNGSVRIWSTITGEGQFSLAGHLVGATGVAFGSGGYNLAAGTGGGQVWLWDPIRGTIGGMMQIHRTGIESVAFTPEDFLVASGSLDGEVRLWDIASRAERAVLAEANDLTPVESVAFSPDGTLLAAGGGNTIRVWDVEAGTVQAVLETEISDIHSVSFRPDGALLAYAGSDPAIWVWDLADDNHALHEGDANEIFALAFSPDGQIIASGESGTVRLWDATTGENLAALTSPAQTVNSVAFSADGALVASGGDSGGVVLWGTSVDGGAEAAASESNGETTTTGETTTSASGCTITSPGNANLRSGPGTEFDRAGALSGGQTAEVDGQAIGGDGMTWYRLTDGAWVRSDVIDAPAECAGVEAVTS